MLNDIFYLCQNWFLANSDLKRNSEAVICMEFLNFSMSQFCITIKLHVQFTRVGLSRYSFIGTGADKEI